MREHISCAKELNVENAGAHLVGEIIKIGKCGSASCGGKRLKLENAGAHIVGETAIT